MILRPDLQLNFLKCDVGYYAILYFVVYHHISADISCEVFVINIMGTAQNNTALFINSNKQTIYTLYSRQTRTTVSKD